MSDIREFPIAPNGAPMKRFVVYAVWTGHRIVEAPSEDVALAEPPVFDADELSLCNWHAVEIPSHQQLVDALQGMLDQPETPEAYAAMIERAQAALVTAQER